MFERSIAKKESTPASHHAAVNQRQKLATIDYENARLYVKLRNRSCHVSKVEELMAHYKHSQNLKMQISKQGREPVGMLKNSSISPIRSNQRNLIGTIPVLRPTNPYKDLQSSYYEQASKRGEEVKNLEG